MEGGVKIENGSPTSEECQSFSRRILASSVQLIFIPESVSLFSVVAESCRVALKQLHSEDSKIHAARTQHAEIAALNRPRTSGEVCLGLPEGHS